MLVLRKKHTRPTVHEALRALESAACREERIASEPETSLRIAWRSYRVAACLRDLAAALRTATKGKSRP